MVALECTYGCIINCHMYKRLDNIIGWQVKQKWDHNID